MVQFLESGKLTVPEAITDPPSRNADDMGVVVPSFDQGTLFLKHSNGRHYRLEWGTPSAGTTKGKSARPDARRALPRGTYETTGYRIVRRDSAGKLWFISVTSHGGQKIDVRPRETTRVTIREEINFVCRTQKSGEEIKLTAAITGSPRGGLSIYRDGKRIPLKYAIQSADGKELQSGELDYG